MTAEPLASRFDAVLFDLDGVVYVGPTAVPHAAEAIRGLRGLGIGCGFITNNASRSAHTVAEHLAELGIEAADSDVVTSPQAAVSLLPEYVPAGSRVLVIGGRGIEDALTAAGYLPVHTLAEEPAAVMQGFSPDLSWRDLAEATFAVRAGLPWIATNQDLTFPAPGGIAPGNGALVQLVAQTAGRAPDAVAGKPEPPLLMAAIARLGAQRPLMVGDRLDTDIAAGSRVGVPSLLVFTGVATLGELLAAAPPERPQYLGADLRILLTPYPTLEVSDDAATSGRAQARMAGERIEVRPGEDPWDSVRAAAALAWRMADEGRPVDRETVVATLAAAVG